MKKQTTTENTIAIKTTKQVQITPEMERRMRVIANLIIDRIFEDKKNGKLNQRAKDEKEHITQ